MIGTVVVGDMVMARANHHRDDIIRMTRTMMMKIIMMKSMMMKKIRAVM